MDETGAVEKHVHGPDLRDQRFDRSGVEDVQPVGADARLTFKATNGVRVDIGRMDLGTGLGEGKCGCASMPCAAAVTRTTFPARFAVIG